MRESAAAVRAIMVVTSVSLLSTLPSCGSNRCLPGAAACRDAGIDTPSTIDVGTADQGRDAPDEGRDAPLVGHDGPVEDADHVVDGAIDAADARPVADGGPMDAAPGGETSKCAPGRVRVHVRDIWSQGISPSLGVVPGRPAAILVITGGGLNTFGARLDSGVDVAGGPCTYYSACIPNTTVTVNLEPTLPTGCPHVSYSSAIDISAVNRSGEFWIDYTGTSSTLAADYAQTPMVPVGPGKFQVTVDSSTLVAPACKIGAPPPEPPIADTIRVHFRWPWTDPIKTGYPGAACGDDALGYSPPPYPTSLALTGLSCSLQALLELQNGACTWYSALVPKSTIPINANATLWFEYPDFVVGLRTATITLPTLSNPANEYWVAFTGASSGADASTAAICGALQYSNVYTVSTQNPGPAYPGCGGGQ